MAMAATVIFLLCILQHISMVQSARTKLRNRIAELKTSVDVVDNTLSMIANLLSENGEDECYKGMASLNKPLRTVVTIPGNRTALCDTVTDQGGWIVFLRRSDGKEDFYRNWDEYKAGFGDIEAGGDYWLGNEILHQLTWRRTFELRVDMEHQGQKYYAQYSTFYLGDETTSYTLHVGGYSGDAGDSLSHHNNGKFTTFDVDNDNYGANCAVTKHGAWWYKACYLSQLTGVWGATNDTGINWPWSTRHGLSFTEMKIRLI